MKPKPFKDALPQSVLSILPVLLFLTGCATPPEVKTASQAQLQLIGALDNATVALSDGLAHFHQDQQARILNEGRVLIARQAINVAVPDSNALSTADGVFKVSNDKVRVWVDNAFAGPEIDAAIAKTQDRLRKATDPFLQGSLQNDLDDLNLNKAKLSQKPKYVAELESIIQDEAKLEDQTSQNVTSVLQVLREQLGLMKTAAITVDNWLSVDITLSKEQADSLEKAFSDAKTAFDKGPK